MTLPEKWWVDPPYDPLQELQDCKRDIDKLQKLCHGLITVSERQQQEIIELQRQARLNLVNNL